MPLPRGMTDVVWGNTICELKKYAHLGLSYNEMAQRASASHEMLTYLMWLKKTYGEEGVRQIYFTQEPKVVGEGQKKTLTRRT